MRRRAEVITEALGIGPDDPNVHDFADSVRGRALSEAIIKSGKLDPEAKAIVQKAYEDFIGEIASDPMEDLR